MKVRVGTESTVASRIQINKLHIPRREVYGVHLNKLILVFPISASPRWPKNVFTSRAARCIRTLKKNASIIPVLQFSMKDRRVSFIISIAELSLCLGDIQDTNASL